MKKHLPPLSLPKAMQAYQFMRVGSAIFTGILLAKTQLTTSEIGVWESLLFIGSMVVFTGINGFLQAISPLYSRQNETNKAVFLFIVFATFLAIALGVCLLLLVFQSQAIPLFTGQLRIEGFEWYILFLFLHIPCLPVEFLFLLKEKPVSIVLWGIVGFGFQLAAIAIPACMGWGLVCGLQFLCLVALGRFFWMISLLARYAIPYFDRGLSRAYMQMAAPLAANSFTGNLILFFDNWLVGFWFANPAIFALFRYGSREFPLALAFSTALGTYIVPRLSTNFVEGIRELKTRSTRLLHYTMPLTILLLGLAPQIFPIVFNPSFSSAAPLFQIYLFITLSRVLLPNAILVALGDTRAVFWVGIAELALKIVLGFAMVQWWDLAGIAWSAVFAFWFEKIALSIYLYRRHGIALQQWLNLKIYGFYAILLWLTWIGCKNLPLFTL